MAQRLVPPNSTTLETALEQATARVSDVPAPLRELWNPDTCPAALLPWLAWALSIDNWNAGWSEAVKRSRVRTAMAIQRRKGTAKSVRDVVASFGGWVALREWWQTTPPGAPYTFEMVITLGVDGTPATARFVDDVIAEVERTKPARAHFTFTQGLLAGGRVGVAAVARPAVYRRLQLDAV